MVSLQAKMVIYKLIYIQKSQMWLPSGTGNPDWSRRQPEQVCFEAASHQLVIKANLMLDKIRLNIPFTFDILWPFGSGTWP